MRGTRFLTRNSRPLAPRAFAFVATTLERGFSGRDSLCRPALCFRTGFCLVDSLHVTDEALVLLNGLDLRAPENRAASIELHSKPVHLTSF
jgi:hypothetical protein